VCSMVQIHVLGCLQKYTVTYSMGLTRSGLGPSTKSRTQTLSAFAYYTLSDQMQSTVPLQNRKQVHERLDNAKRLGRSTVAIDHRALTLRFSEGR
jgi:hypothetical protein